jgi:hypothetical protein
MFIDDDFIDIVVYYKKIGMHYEAYSKEGFNELDLSEEEKDKYEKLCIKAKPLTWGFYNDMQESATVTDQMGNRKWNYKLYKQNKLKNIISSWDATIKNEKGEVIPAPINENIILRLAPEVAEVILNCYDHLTLIDENEEKKS